MIPAVCLAMVGWAGPASFVETRLQLPGRILTFETPDVDDDGRGDLAVVVEERGHRAMLVYLQDAAAGFPGEPGWRWTLPDEVVAFAFFDLRTDAGLELLLLSRRGLYSISPAAASVRGNLRTEIKAELFPELPDRSGLPRWDWFVDVDGDGSKEILLPGAGALLAFRPEQGKGSPLVQCFTIPCREVESTHSAGLSIKLGDALVGARNRPMAEAVFPRTESTFPPLDDSHLLDRTHEIGAPHLLDWDSDGRLDLVGGLAGFLNVRLGTATGFAEKPKRWERWSGGGELRLVDLDQDGRPELIKIDEQGDGLSKDHEVAVIPRDRGGEPAAEATAVLRFGASDAEYSFHDVDSDGFLDLVVRLVDLPSTLGALTDLKIESSILIHRGGAGFSLSKKPDARFERVLRPEELSRILELLVVDLSADFDGDGRNDLLTIRPDGLVEIRPLVASAGGIAFASEASSVYLPPAPVRDAWPCWLTRDGIADLVLRHEDALTVFVSVKGAQ